MALAVYAGSFDPLTNGHMAIIRSGLRLAERLVVAIGAQSDKKPLFTAKERQGLIMAALKSLPPPDRKRVEVITFSGLLAAKAQALKADFLLRGLRGGADLEYELQMAAVNRSLAPNLPTVFLPAEEGSRFISSSMLRQLAALGGNVAAFAPANVAQALAAKYAALKS